ncbi:MAG: hypothetical protein ACE5JR_06240 [Gemmatimonadota bacterium]
MQEAPRYQRLFAELKRRNVFRVAAVYGATAFVVLQVVDLFAEGLDLPAVVLRSLTVFILAGFPIALVLAWAFEATRRLSPGNAEAHEYAGYVLRRVGRFDKSTEALEQAGRLDPRNLTLLWNLGINYRVQRRFDEAARRFAESLAVLPENDRGRGFWFESELFGRGDIEAATRIARDSPGFRRPDARALAESWLALYGRHFGAAIEARPVPPGGDRFGRVAAARSVLGIGLALRGGASDAAEAIRMGEEAVRIYGTDRDVLDGFPSERYLLRIYLLTGQRRDALDAIERFLARPSFLAAGELRLDPIYDPLRGDPRFEELVLRAEALAVE